MTRLAVTCAMVVCALSTAHAHPCPVRRRVADERDTMVYLQRLGYMPVPPPGEIAEMPAKEWNWAIRTFQKKARIKVTGELDEPTMEMLNKPRCGVYDVTQEERQDALADEDVSKRRKRFAVSEGKWPRTTLTYRISQYTPDLPEFVVDVIIAHAFQKWSSVTPLTFVLRPRGEVDLDLRFVSQLHGDNAPFDGPGGTLAHAFFPPTTTWFPAISGDTHFDDAETWIEVNGRAGTPLLCVAIHEIGHSLGVRHSEDQDSIMWPWAGQCQSEVDLGQDDVNVIQHLYGSKATYVTSSQESSTVMTSLGVAMTSTETILMTVVNETTTSEVDFTESFTSVTMATNTTLEAVTSVSMATMTVAEPKARACDGSVDAIVNTDDGYVYAFRGADLFRLHEGVAFGFPRPISDVFPGAPRHVTAAMTSHKRQGRRRGHKRGRHQSETTYLFSGDQVWRYQYDRRRDGFRAARGSNPASIARVFPGVHASHIGGATVSADNGDIYLFSGARYWRHKGEKKRLASRSYPRPWAHHPIFSHVGTDPASTIDGALLHRDRNYFFSGQSFFRWDRVNRRMSGGRDTAYFLFWCPAGVRDQSQRRAVFDMVGDSLQ